MPILFTRCTGGIGDRFKMLCNSMYLANIWDKELVIKWNTGAHCQLPFKQMFDNPHEYCKIDQPEKHIKATTPANVPGDIFITSGSIMHFRLPFIPNSQFLNLIGSLSIKQSIKERAKRISDRMELSTDDYGFQMRRTDKGHMCALDRQLLKLSSIAKGSQRVLVTSDEAEAELGAKKRFPNNVITRKKTFPIMSNGKIIRSPGSMKDGIIDMLLLVGTTMVLCRPGSNFVNTVRFLQQAPECEPAEFLLVR